MNITCSKTTIRISGPIVSGDENTLTNKYRLDKRQITTIKSGGYIDIPVSPELQAFNEMMENTGKAEQTTAKQAQHERGE